MVEWHFHQLVVSKFAEQGDARCWRVDGRSIACALTLVEAVLKDLYLFDGGGLVSPKIGEVELIDYLTGLFVNCLSRSGDRTMPHRRRSEAARRSFARRDQ